MGRSVSTHRHAVATVYLHLEFEDGDEFAWSDFIEDLRDNVLRQFFPSLSPCSRWADREDHVIAENHHCEISVSEYCGIVAVCLAPIDPYNNFSVAWCHRASNSFQSKIEKSFSKSVLRSIGRFSNGEQVFKAL